MSFESDRDIRELLDRAGRDAQPRSERWDALSARLSRLPQFGRRAVPTWRALVGVAAMLAIVVGIIVWHWAGGPVVVAATESIRVEPVDVEVTAFNEVETQGVPLFMPLRQYDSVAGAFDDQGEYQSADVPDFVQREMTQPEYQQFVQMRMGRWMPTVRSGMALVKDRRIVLNLKAGDNVVRFTDVAAAIDPTSVRFVSLTDPTGTVVVEQNFEYDLATADALLTRYVDKQVTCVTKTGESFAGYLCSYEPSSLVLAESPPREDRGDRKTQTIAREALAAIRLPDVPKDLCTKPTLVWTLRTQRPGRHDTVLSYVCGDVKWEANYVVVIAPGPREQGDRLDWQGWVTMDNRSGATYRDAKIKLIAGDVNRVVDPWAVQPRPEIIVGSPLRALHALNARVDFLSPSMDEKSFFEYHLYTLSFPSTVRDQQIKQLKLLRANGVSATRRFVAGPGDEHPPIGVQLEFKNEEANHLGMPLPKGPVRLMQYDADGNMEQLATDSIDHTPKDEEMTLHVGAAFDVTAERIQTDEQHPGEQHAICSFRLRMRNHRAEAINGRFIEATQPGWNWVILASSDPWTKHDANTAYFDFALDPDQEKTITYTVDYTW